MANKVVLYFGDREVGSVTLTEGRGIGETLFVLGIDVLSELKHYSPADGRPFLEALCRECNGPYFRARLGSADEFADI